MTETAELFWVLADPTRRAIFERLALGEATVSQLRTDIAVSQPAIAQHLAALRHAGLLAQRRSGRQIYYRIEPVGLRPLVDWLEHYQTFWHNRLSRLKTLLEELES